MLDMLDMLATIKQMNPLEDSLIYQRIHKTFLLSFRLKHSKTRQSFLKNTFSERHQLNISNCDYK